MDGEEITAQVVVKCCLRFKTTRAYEIHHVIKVMTKFNLRSLNNLIPLISCISTTVFALGVIKLRIVNLNLLIDSIFLILLLSLLRSLIQYRKNEFSNTLAVAEIGLNLFCVFKAVRFAPSLTALW